MCGTELLDFLLCALILSFHQSLADMDGKDTDEKTIQDVTDLHKAGINHKKICLKTVKHQMHYEEQMYQCIYPI